MGPTLPRRRTNRSATEPRLAFPRKVWHPMSSRTALAGLFVAIALVVVVAPVAIAPAGDRAFADVAATRDPAPPPMSRRPIPSRPRPASTETRPHGAGGAVVHGPPAAADIPPAASPRPSRPRPSHPPRSRSPGSPVFRSPVGGTNGPTVRLDLAGTRDYVAQTNLVQCVGASVQMMLNIIKPGADRTAAFQHRLQVQARSLSGPTPPGFVRSGAGVFGWAAGADAARWRRLSGRRRGQPAPGDAHRRRGRSTTSAARSGCSSGAVAMPG